MKKLAIGLVSIAVVVGIVAAANGPQPSVGLYWYDNTDPTTGGGMSAPLNQLLVRTDSPSIYYKSGSTNTAWTKIGTASGGGGGGTVTEVDCGTGMSCSPSPITTVGTVNVSLTPTTCAGGMAEVATAANGTSTCATFFDATGVGLTSSGATVSANLSGASCSAGQAVTTISSAGAGTCNTFFNTAGTGLTNSGSTVSANLAGAACSAGQAVTAISAGGAGTCSAVGSVTSGTLTSGTIPKATGASALANSSVTDNGTTVATTEAISGTGGATFTKGTTTDGFAVGVISATGITGTQNDFNPTGWFTGSVPTAQTIELTLTGATTINGLAGGVAGRQACFINTGANTATFANEAVGSTAANRFTMVDAVGWVLSNGFIESMCFVYDSTSSRWRQLGTAHLATLQVGNALGVTGGSTFTGAVQVNNTLTTGSTNNIANGGHFRTTSTALTTTNLSSCGAAPAIDSHSTDTAGLITLGAAAQTTCTLTFAATFTNTPFCTCTNAGSASTGTLLFCNPTATTLVITAAASTAAAIISYHCIGS